MNTVRSHLLIGAGLAALALSAQARAQDVQPPTPPTPPAAPGRPAGTNPPPAPEGAENNLPPPYQAQQEERAQGSPTKPRFDPYPVTTAGWSRPRSNYFFDSRWEEDWTQLQELGKAPPLKAMPLFGDLATLTLSAEDRLRAHFYTNGGLTKNNDYTELQNRAIVGADLHVTDYFRLYAEVGHGDVSEDGHPNVQSVTGKQGNTLALQQLFGDFNYHTDNFLVGAMVGRMEWTDAPEQLVSAGNGPNLHTTWNGYRLYVHTGRFRLGYFSGYPTVYNLGGVFNQDVFHGEWLHSATAGVVLVDNGSRANLSVTGLYIDNFNAKSLQGNTTGEDHRYTYGARMVGRMGRYTIDWMGYRQTGDHIGRPVDAFLASVSQTAKVDLFGFPVDAGFRFDIASGGGGQNKTGVTHLFNPIYTDKGIYGESELFTYQNVMVYAPNVSVRITSEVAPEPRVRLRLSREHKRRLLHAEQSLFEHAEFRRGLRRRSDPDEHLLRSHPQRVPAARGRQVHHRQLPAKGGLPQRLCRDAGHHLPVLTSGSPGRRAAAAPALLRAAGRPFDLYPGRSERDPDDPAQRYRPDPAHRRQSGADQRRHSRHWVRRH